MGTEGAGNSPEASTASLTVVELFDRLEVLSVLLSENADRWLLSASRASTARILDERTALHRERDEIERELRTRTLETEGGAALLEEGV